jgi:hypothetical protein
VSAQEIGAIEQDGRLWLDARQVIDALRDRAERYEALADGEPVPGMEESAYRMSCLTAAAALVDRADALDLECLARVNGG